MVNDRGLLNKKLNKVVTSIHVSVPNIVTILDTLALLLEVYQAVLDLANVTFLYACDHRVIRSIPIVVGMTTMDFARASVRLHA